MTAEFLIKKKYNLVPPDGGYGYMILVAASVNFISTTMFAVCFGMLFQDFFTKTGMGATDISVLTGMNALSSAISAFLTGPLLKVMSRRKLALIGSVIYNTGTIGSVFVNTKAQLIICQGFLLGSGFGVLYNVSFTMLNDYFVGKRLFCVSFANAASALTGMVAPTVVSWSMAEYGFRGTLVVISAVGLQTFVASALLQPVSWHMKEEVVDYDQENKLLLQMEKVVNEPSNKSLQTPVVKLNEIKIKGDLFSDKKDDMKPSVVIIAITRVKSFLDWPLFKRFVLTCAGLGAPIVLFADNNIAVYFLAQFLYDMKWTSDQVKWALSLIGIGDIAGRIFLMVSSSWLTKLGSHPIYVAGILVAIASRLGLLWVSNYAWRLAIITVMGVSRCVIVVLYPVVVSDSVEPEQFPSAMGMNLMMFGIISISMGPVVGAIGDATGNYTAMFLVLLALMMVTAVAWIIELVRGRRKILRTLERETD